MYKRININAAVEHIKIIVDNIRCAVCDTSGGSRMRYACGHTSCEDCVDVAVDCSICLTPPQSASKEPLVDKPFTQRAKNSVNLLNVFEKEFHIDVYRRQRISEQLKIEKELFPECIQAPVKYFNKRKSLRSPKSNKENKLSKLIGENISPRKNHKMEQSSNNVQKWLNKYVRKPFTDLNSYDERLTRDSIVLKRQQNIMDIENINVPKSTRKRHFKTSQLAVKNQSQDKHLTTIKKKDYCKKPRIENNLSVNSDTSKYFEMVNDTKATDNDESGIVLDDEAVIFIDDSQSIRIDKDVNAWLAVQEAENKKQSDSASIISSKSSEQLLDSDIEKAIEAKIEITTKVPFYLKSCLADKCIDCNRSNIDESDSHIVEPTKDVSITVENQSFTAIIKVTVENNKKIVYSKQSVEVQTDLTGSSNNNEKSMNSDHVTYLDHDKVFVKQVSPIIVCNSQSQDLFKDDGMHLESVNTQNVIIEDSDSDGELEASVSLEVTAEIHRSCEEIDYGILTDVENLGEHSKRPRRIARGFTPTSTDSSEKENFNPNRKKKAPSSKKKPMKK